MEEYIASCRNEIVIKGKIISPEIAYVVKFADGKKADIDVNGDVLSVVMSDFDFYRIDDDNYWAVSSDRVSKFFSEQKQPN